MDGWSDVEERECVSKLIDYEKTKELIKQTKALNQFTEDLDALMNKLVNQKQNWLTKSIFKMIK